MRKILKVYLLLTIVLTCISPSVNAVISVTEDAMTESITRVNSSIANTMDVYNPKYLTEILDENNNVPAYEYYPTHLNSRQIKALKAYDGKVFMGLGDWNDNTGPVKVLYYDTVDGKVKTSGTIADEAIQIFNIIDDKLYTTGCDPRANWGDGSYYIYNKDENKWEQHKKSNGWIHVFNIVKFKDKLYMCGSINDDSKYTVIQSSSDNGETFENISIYKNNETVNYKDVVRCYDLAVVNGKLYGYIRNSNNSQHNGIYLYDENNNRFDYISNLPSSSYSKYSLSSLRSYNLTYFRHTVFNDELLYPSGTDLFRTKDMVTFEKVKMNTEDVVQDIVVSGDTLYTLSYAYNQDKTYTTRIYSTKNLTDFNLLYEFRIETPPFCIEYYDNSFYIGTAYGNSSNSKDYTKNGSLYRINLKNTERKLSIDKDNVLINVTDGDETYSVTYNIAEDKSTFELKLSFNNNMTKKQFAEEYYKINSFDIIFATVANIAGVPVEEAMEYFAKIASDKLKTPAAEFSTGIQYAKDNISKGLIVEDSLFTITASEGNESEDKYEVKVTLTIDNNGEFPVTNNSTTNNSPENDYSNNNNTLPQTGNFFGVKNLLQIIIIISALLIVFFKIKK